MNGGDVLEVLKEIRDETKQTNVRLDQTNARLESLEGRVEFLEKRTSKGLKDLGEQLNAQARAQAEAEMRVATEIVSLAELVRQVRDSVVVKLEDHAMVLNHEQRIRALENSATGSGKR